MRPALLLLVLLPACSGGLSQEELKDPAQCQSCHGEIYRQWSGSMHAYAGEDPVFLAMNALGQKETQGALGDFCIKCHAPLALAAGLTHDGQNLKDVDKKLRGVTCYFCHQIDAVTGTHNAGLKLVEDGVMRAGISDPFPAGAHASKYSRLHDREQLDSSSMCGACHDVVTPSGLALERGFDEWKGTLFADPANKEHLSCGSCHMPGHDGLVATQPVGAPIRRVKSHMWPAVDTALIDFPERETQKAAVQAELDTAIQAFMCIVPTSTGANVQVDLENIAAGHGFPSGAALDRRVFLELKAYFGERLIYETGSRALGEVITSTRDPDLWLFRDQVFDAQDREVHQFWQGARSEPFVLPGPVTRDPMDPRYAITHKRKTFAIPRLPNRVTMRVRVQPLARETLEALVKEGFLDPAVADSVPIFDLGTTVLEWKADRDDFCVPKRT
ncbi:MAG: multiheme c-type cytochrome [Myxococcota bacterium]